MKDQAPGKDADTLLADNLPLVEAVAHRAYPTFAYNADLIQCGRIALWRAALRWDGARPFRPYACACIHNAMSRCARALCRWSALPTDDYRPGPVPGPEEAVVDAVALRERIESVWRPGSREHYVLTRLADGVPKEQVAAALGRSTWDVTRLSRRAWRRVPQ